ncbi:nuclear transport factor 2 family protein [Thalassospira sp.]|uniref:nuclear transport factor 2 family protein n=1 Tax=Thalassospira sp. TaxID=1912094 RepID=UPI00262EE215|nr:nuclear transport factor 2 family protein [Thalassospira sp.]MCH2274485.1 nuclear transport factor 2 family protein [Thalassospira sp.]
MTHDETRIFLENLFGLLLDPERPAEDLLHLFTSDYVQIADGKTLDLKDFVAHARTLKSILKSAHVRFEKIITSNNSIADIHIVDAIKKDGSTMTCKVLTFYEMRDGKISRIEELSHLIAGAKEDSDLASRIAH